MSFFLVAFFNYVHCNFNCFIDIIDAEFQKSVLNQFYSLYKIHTVKL